MSEFLTHKATPQGKAETLRRRTVRLTKTATPRITKSGHPANPTTTPTPTV